ncbi:hypothetical protein BDV18DRAFT_167327 [Aspergillus unguis]
MDSYYCPEPEHIPATDLYADIPHYGRYRPKPGDFRVQPEHIGSHSSSSMQYWESVVDICNESTRIYPADECGRDVFTLGNLIIKSSHLHNTQEINYLFTDANEVGAIHIAEKVLQNIRVPEIYFTGKIHGRQVLIQERLPGVALSVAWPYLSQSQKHSFKEQANGRISPLEGHIIFSNSNGDPDLSFMHNDFTQSNCIVNNNKIVGLIDWEMAGFLGWKTAGEVHRRIRTPQREHFVNVSLSEESLQDIMFWNDL